MPDLSALLAQIDEEEERQKKLAEQLPAFDRRDDVSPRQLAIQRVQELQRRKQTSTTGRAQLDPASRKALEARDQANIQFLLAQDPGRAVERQLEQPELPTLAQFRLLEQLQGRSQVPVQVSPLLGLNGFDGSAEPRSDQLVVVDQPKRSVAKRKKK